MNHDNSRNNLCFEIGSYAERQRSLRCICVYIFFIIFLLLFFLRTICVFRGDGEKRNCLSNISNLHCYSYCCLCICLFLDYSVQNIFFIDNVYLLYLQLIFDTSGCLGQFENFNHAIRLIGRIILWSIYM